MIYLVSGTNNDQKKAFVFFLGYSYVLNGSQYAPNQHPILEPNIYSSKVKQWCFKYLTHMVMEIIMDEGLEY